MKVALPITLEHGPDVVALAERTASFVLGISEDLPLPWFYDGPSETHRWSIARRITRRVARDQE